MKLLAVLFSLGLVGTLHPALGKSSESPNSQALKSMQFIKKGMAIAGVEELFKIKDPKKISTDLKRQLKESLTPKHTVWTVANIKWNSSWETIFPEPTGAIVQSVQMEAPLKAKDLKLAESLLKRTKVNTNERARLLWVLAHHYGIQNTPSKASPLLEELMKSEQSLIEPDLIVMTVARLYYQINQLEKSIQHYNMITKASDYWIESVEERAWAYFRKGDYDHVQSDMKTIMNPIFANQVGPEPFFLDGFAKLKVCDYVGIFKTIKDFKSMFKDRITVMDSLAKTGSNESVQPAVAKLADGTSTFQDMGSVAAKMPRFFYRDWQLSRLAMRKAIFERENQPGANSAFAARLATLSQDAAGKVKSRVKTLASIEMDEARKILNKFHILEAEVIQRMHIQDKKSDKDIEHQTIAGDELEFPVSGDEVWADELDKYQVLSRGCPDNKQAKAL